MGTKQAGLFQMQGWRQTIFICFRIKFYEDWVSKLNKKIGFFVPSTRHQNCLDNSLMLDLGFKLNLLAIMKNEKMHRNFLKQTARLSRVHLSSLKSS